MSDSNPTRRRASINKKAFTNIIGDPFSKEDLEGTYQTMKHRSPLSATRSFGEGIATRNPATPNAVDFCVDVEAIVIKVLKDDPELLEKFITVYLLGTTESIENSTITLAEQQFLEQRMGRQFIVAGLSPAVKYFTAIRGRKNA